METLEARIRKLEDRAEIQDLVARYFKVADDDDEQALGQCFTADARFLASGFVGGESGEGILAFLKSARAHMDQTVHTPHYVHIAFTGADTATGTVMAHLEIGIGGTTVFGALRYIDEYRRDGGQWRISSREMLAVHISSWDQAASSLTEPLNIRWPGAEPAPSDLPRQSG